MQKLKWKRATFKLALREPKQDTREGISCGLFTIHREYVGCYKLSHLASGLALMDYKRAATARQVAARLASLPVDWTSPDPLRELAPEQRDEIKALVRSAA
jgi:hypothetical protein